MTLNISTCRILVIAAVIFGILLTELPMHTMSAFYMIFLAILAVVLSDFLTQDSVFVEERRNIASALRAPFIFYRGQELETFKGSELESEYLAELNDPWKIFFVRVAFFGLAAAYIFPYLVWGRLPYTWSSTLHLCAILLVLPSRALLHWNLVLLASTFAVIAGFVRIFLGGETSAALIVGFSLGYWFLLFVVLNSLGRLDWLLRSRARSRPPKMRHENLAMLVFPRPLIMLAAILVLGSALLAAVIKKLPSPDRISTEKAYQALQSLNQKLGEKVNRADAGESISSNRSSGATGPSTSQSGGNGHAGAPGHSSGSHQSSNGSQPPAPTDVRLPSPHDLEKIAKLAQNDPEIKEQLKQLQDDARKKNVKLPEMNQPTAAESTSGTDGNSKGSKDAQLPNGSIEKTEPELERAEVKINPADRDNVKDQLENLRQEIAKAPDAATSGSSHASANQQESKETDSASDTKDGGRPPAPQEKSNGAASTKQTTSESAPSGSGQPNKPFISEPLLKTLLSVLTWSFLGIGVLVILRLLSILFSRPPAETKHTLSPVAQQDLQQKLKQLSKQSLSSDEEVIAKYNLFMDVMSGLNLAREEWLPTTDYKCSLTKRLPKMAESIESITRIYHDTYYGEQSVDQEQMSTFRKDFSFCVSRFIK